MDLNWSLGISLYMLAGGILADRNVRNVLEDEECVEKLYRENSSIIVNMLYNRPFVFAMGCLVGLPGYLLGVKDKFIDKK